METCWWKYLVEGRGPIYWGGRVDWEGTRLLTEAAMQCLYHQTFKHGRQRQLCLYIWRKINGDNHQQQQVNIVQSASGRWTLDRQLFAILEFAILERFSIKFNLQISPIRMNEVFLVSSF